MVGDVEVLFAREIEKLGEAVFGGVGQVSASIKFWRSFYSSTLARTVSIFRPTPVFWSWVACS